MKEIDLLPEWYKSSRRRQLSIRRQYIALGCMLVMMMVWNFITTHSVSRATAQSVDMALTAAEAENDIKEFNKIKDKVTELEKRADILEKTDSKINVANVLAEVSFLIDEKVVLSKVELCAEKFDLPGAKHKGRRGTQSRRYGSGAAGSNMTLLGGARFKVIINGVAADASDVAKLICKLEDSPYFWLVYPSFSRNRNLQPGWMKSRIRRAGANQVERNLQVSEFEVTCYLANYKDSIIDSSMINKLAIGNRL